MTINLLTPGLLQITRTGLLFVAQLPTVRLAKCRASSMGLSDCDTPQEIDAIRSFAPVTALKSAARLLDENVRMKVKELTEIANQNRNLGFGMS